MESIDFLELAKSLQAEIVENRRTIHAFGGTGFDIQPTTDYVVSKLREYGYQPKIVAKTGIVCTVGNGDKVILLRADMDALPMQEETGLSFACTSGSAHTCGHDAHTSMLLAAAKMLKTVENDLKGTVKIIFQPAEEIMQGAIEMIHAGVLENPKVDFAFSMHNIVGTECPGMPTGAMRYTPGYTYTSCGWFEIEIVGHGCHGAKPNEGVDAVNIGAKIVTAIHEILAMEVQPTECAVMTVGQFEAGSAPNVISERAILRGTIRTYNAKVHAFVKDRLVNISETIAKAYRGTAKVHFSDEIPAVYSDLTNSVDIRKYYTEIMPEHYVFETAPSMASEDFAFYGEHIPTVMVGLSLGCPEEGYLYGGHHPKMNINEEGLPVGAALYAQVAYRWLEDHAN